MGGEPAIALVFSPDAWVEQFHRFVADHGGARIRLLVVDPAVLDDEEFDVLVSSDRWPSLTPSLVERMRARRVLLCGVFDPEEPAGKDHLLAVGVDAAVAADAPSAEIVEVIVISFFFCLALPRNSRFVRIERIDSEMADLGFLSTTIFDTSIFSLVYDGIIPSTGASVLTSSSRMLVTVLCEK